MGAAYLDEVGVAVQAEEAATGGGDALGGPGGLIEKNYLGGQDGFEAGEAVLNLGGELGVGSFVLASRLPMPTATAVCRSWIVLRENDPSGRRRTSARSCCVDCGWSGCWDWEASVDCCGVAAGC